MSPSAPPWCCGCCARVSPCGCSSLPHPNQSQATQPGRAVAGLEGPAKNREEKVLKKKKQIVLPGLRHSQGPPGEARGKPHLLRAAPAAPSTAPGPSALLHPNGDRGLGFNLAPPGLQKDL